MANKNWYDRFMETLNKKFPKNALLVQALVDLLPIEKEAVYRRLRRDVFFTSEEIAKISFAWNISMDKIVGVDSDKVNFQMYPVNFYDPKKSDLDYLQKTIQLFSRLKEGVFSEYIEVCNKIPRSLFVRFPHIRNFYKFIWMYKYDSENNEVPYSKVVFSEQMQKIMSDYVISTGNITEMHYIFDKSIFNDFIDDVRYFHEIDLIIGEEKELIKKDLLKLLEFLSDATKTGIFPDTKNKIYLYVSHINIDTSYSSFCTDDYKVFRVHIFGEYESKNYDATTVLNFKKLLQSKKHTAYKISADDEKSRKKYFSEQRELIEGF